MADTESDAEFESADEGSDDGGKISPTVIPSDPGFSLSTAESGVDGSGQADGEAEEIKDVTSGTDTQELTDTQIDAFGEQTEVAKSTSHEAEEGDKVKTERESTPTRRLHREEVKDLPSERENDVLEKLGEAADKKQGSSSWGTWGSWSSSLLSSASASVSTFTKSVGHGVSAVLETVEHGLDIPSPEELAYSDEATDAAESIDCSSKEEPESASPSEMPAEECKEDSSKDGGEGFFVKQGFFSEITHGLSNIVENTVEVGLEALETVGKKTMEQLTAGDPGLRKKRSYFAGSSKPNLSQVLREAKEKAEQEAENKKEEVERQQANFSFLFDEFQGLAHLEALEMLSSQSESAMQNTMQSLSPSKQESVNQEFKQLSDIFVVDDVDDNIDDETDHDFVTEVQSCTSDLGTEKNLEKLVSSQMSIRANVREIKSAQDKGEQRSGHDVHKEAIKCLAELTAIGMETFHKSGELLLANANKMDFTSHLIKATTLKRLCLLLCTETAIVAAKFSQCLSTSADDAEEPDLITPLITNVYFEATNSTSYIQDGLHLLLPVLQRSLIQHCNTCTDNT